MSSSTKISPFLAPGPVATADNLALIHLKRDLQQPTVLRTYDDEDEGYAEGKVVNTRFGSFPHKTLIGLPWGSQVRASKVDTGSRGRRNPKDSKKKRTRDDFESESAGGSAAGGETREGTPADKEAIQASSGFIHLIAPTPENWTSSLPHRTQVVYTPDYSYILHRIRVRPGARLIEAGAGSGSFTHASARAVYNGYPLQDNPKRRKIGKVWSYEFHEQRHEKLVKEIKDHRLDGVVHITHRDVCGEGFLVGANADESPRAEAIFLDLPAPWLALPHLTRSSQTLSSDSVESQKSSVSALSPTATVHLCSFSPCMEQVQRTITTMRQLGWTDIDMVEVSQKRLEIRRERIGIVKSGEHERGVQPTAASVDEALDRLDEIEGRAKAFYTVSENKGQATKSETNGHTKQGNDKQGKDKQIKGRGNPNSKEKLLESLIERKVYKEGRLVHRTEGEVKTHTSYLVFAVLQREWSEEDEKRARDKFPIKGGDIKPPALSSREQKKLDRLTKKPKADMSAADGTMGENTEHISMEVEVEATSAPPDSISTMEPGTNTL